MENPLKIEVNEELTLDAGWWEEVDGPPRQRLVLPPKPTMFEQLLNYLERVADSQSDRYKGLSIGREAVAAVAVCLRWGSYLTVLLDHIKPVCAHAQDDAPAAAAEAHGIRLEGAMLPTAKRRYVLLPRRWVVERSFAWMTRFRRLAGDYGRQVR